MKIDTVSLKGIGGAHASESLAGNVLGMCRECGGNRICI